MDELEQLRRTVNNYNEQKNEFQHLFASFFSSEAGNADRGIATLSSCISILEQYLGTTISFNADLEQGDAKKNAKCVGNKQLGQGNKWRCRSATHVLPIGCVYLKSAT